MKTSIITTTVNLPTFLCEYYKNLEKFSHNQEDVRFIIVGDNKTPQIAEDFVKDYSKNRYSTEYWSPSAQDRWLNEKFPNQMEKVRTIIPENDMRRRNFAYLRAIDVDSDVVITIDDDNYPLSEYDWLGLHLESLGKKRLQSVSSINSYVNPCRWFDSAVPFYSRGYPFAYLYMDDAKYSSKPNSREPVLNQGLWLGKPDIDSYTNLIYPDLKTVFSGEDFPSYSIEPDNYFSVNTQNTSFKKELSVFHNLYMEPIFNLPSHRYDDIWAGLFCMKLIHRAGKTATFGKPLVDHRRNTHNYQKDLQTEFVGAAINTKMWDFIKDYEVQSKDYKSGFIEISKGIATEFTKNFTNNMVNKYLKRLADSMRLWIELVETVE
jgi:hypothetical protein